MNQSWFTSVDKTTTTNYHVERYWTIENFSKFVEKSCGHRLVLSTPKFKASFDERSEWYFKLHMNQTNEGHYLGIYLTFLPYNGDVEYQVSQSYFIINKKDVKEQITVSAEPKVFNTQHDNWGWTTFCSVPELLSKSDTYLKNDTLKLYLTFQVSQSDNSYANHPDLVKNLKINRKNAYRILLETGLNSDLIFNVRNEKIKAHRDILIALNPVFYKLFIEDNYIKSSEEINVSDFDPKVFKEVLRYIYTGESPNIYEMPLELIVAANKYQLDKLKLQCEAILNNKLTVESASNILMVVDNFKSTPLFNKTIKFMKQHLESVRKSLSYQTMRIIKPHLLLHFEKDQPYSSY